MVLTPSNNLKWFSIPLLIVGCSSFLSGAVVVFDFVDGIELDGGSGGPVGGGMIGSEMFDTTTGSAVSITTTDIVGYDATAMAFISASGGGPNHETNVQGSAATLGVNSASTPPGAGNDARDFDAGEQWVFVFSEDVELIEIDLAGQGSGEVFQISSPAFATFTLPDGVTGDTHDLGSTLVPAGTAVTFEATAGSIRIPYLEVNVVPEPSSILLLGLGGLAFFSRRRR